MPLPAGTPLPLYQQLWTELPSAEAIVALEPAVNARHAIAIKPIGRSRRMRDIRYGSAIGTTRAQGLGERTTWKASKPAQGRLLARQSEFEPAVSSALRARKPVVWIANA